MTKKVILITGSSRGIGRKTAIALAKKGHVVYATMRNPEACIPFDEENLVIRALDVTVPETIQAVVDEIIQSHHRIDVVINNAGYGLLSPVELVTDEEMQQQFDVNVFGVVRVIQAAIPHMQRQKSGQIINISSIAGIVSNPALGVYAATKHALEAMSASLATTVFPWNIKVTVIEPGPVDTEFAELMPLGQKLQEDSPYQAFAKKYQKRLIGILHEGQPSEEVAELVAKVVEMDNPDFRYQTSERLHDLAKQFVKDPSGNEWVEEQKRNLAEWFPEKE